MVEAVVEAVVEVVVLVLVDRVVGTDVDVADVDVVVGLVPGSSQFYSYSIQTRY